MAYTNAAELLRDISGLFFAYFGEFSLHTSQKTGEKYAYYFNYQNSRLSIVVFLPIANNVNGEPVIVDQKFTIILKATKSPDTLVEMEDVRTTHGWEKRVRERIGALKELVETEVRRCDTCRVVMLPKTMHRREPPRTKFVGLVCPICKKPSWTVFGRGLKTRLHTNLKK
jgi:hypothetical protein